MDINFARRGPLSFFRDDNIGLVKDFVLFAVSQDTSKHLSSVQLSLSGPQATRSKPLKWKAPAMKFRETISADSNILVSALSPSKNSYFLALFDSGPFRTFDTFFVDCGADDLFMDSNLQQICKSHFLNSRPRSRYVWLNGDSCFSVNSSDRSTPITYWKACGDGHFLR
ncbi:hypothetical protein BASA83_009427 [Batrachochytrium salamandrivorans]|nr:hypothetical protein BASA83_009427 [Batrachochytrium salamandrivorans]